MQLQVNLPRAVSSPSLLIHTNNSVVRSTSAWRCCGGGRARSEVGSRRSAFAAVAQHEELSEQEQPWTTAPVRRSISASAFQALQQTSGGHAAGAGYSFVLLPPVEQQTPVAVVSAVEDLSCVQQLLPAVAQQPVMVVYTAMWSEEDILVHTADAATATHLEHLHLTQDALFTLPDFGFVQVMTQDSTAADALGFCDAECVDVATGRRTVLHRTCVGQPWDLVGLSTSTSCCDELVPLTTCDLVRAGSAAPTVSVGPSRADSCMSGATLHEAEDVLPSLPSPVLGCCQEVSSGCDCIEVPAAAAIEAVERSKGSVFGHVVAPWRWAWAWAKAATGRGVGGESTVTASGYGLALAQLLSC